MTLLAVADSGWPLPWVAFFVALLAFMPVAAVSAAFGTAFLVVVTRSL
jgi:hypothetical protein